MVFRNALWSEQTCDRRGDEGGKDLLWRRTTFMSTRSSSNHAMLSFSFKTLAMCMQANAIKCGGWSKIRSVLYVSLTIPLHSLNGQVSNPTLMVKFSPCSIFGSNTFSSPESTEHEKVQFSSPNPHPKKKVLFLCPITEASFLER